MKKIMFVMLLASAGAFGSNKIIAETVFSIGDLPCVKVHRAINAFINDDRYVLDNINLEYLYIRQTTIWNWVAGYLTAKSESQKVKYITNEEIIKKIDLACMKNPYNTLKQSANMLLSDLSQ